MNAVDFDPSISLSSGEATASGDAPIQSAIEAIRSVAECVRIGGINGINNTLEEALGHARYLEELANERVNWVYNASHGPLIDLLEVVALNFAGYSPRTAKELQSHWTAFHEAHLDKPEAKYLQFCHSQGALSVRNGLKDLPQEVQKRVITVAIAPAGVVPTHLCYASYNYASKNDPTPLGELFLAGLFNSKEVGHSCAVERVFNYRKELILLDPHPNATGIDHDFQSPTFRDVIVRHLNDYLEKEGNYTARDSKIGSVGVG